MSKHRRSRSANPGCTNIAPSHAASRREHLADRGAYAARIEDLFIVILARRHSVR